MTGTFNLVRLVAVAMLANAPDPETGERGVIVNTASGAATQGQMGQAAYGASKAGIVGMTLPVARDLAEHGIRVVTISPGLFETSLVGGLPPFVAQGIIDKSILFPHRIGHAREFGMPVRHVAENPYLNATTISLDAGARMAARSSRRADSIRGRARHRSRSCQCQCQCQWLATARRCCLGRAGACWRAQRPHHAWSGLASGLRASTACMGATLIGHATGVADRRVTATGGYGSARDNVAPSRSGFPHPSAGV